MRDEGSLAEIAITDVVGAAIVPTSELPPGVAVAVDPDPTQRVVYICSGLPLARYCKALRLAALWLERGSDAVPEFKRFPPLHLVVPEQRVASPVSVDTCSA